jgi:thiol-disulfide isomerase/thioredoxin
MKVIKIGAVWCSGCLVMKPRWQEIEKENPWLKTKYYDFDEDEKKLKKYKLDKGKMPAFIFLDKKGKEFLRLHGEVPKDKLVETILKNRNK